MSGNGGNRIRWVAGGGAALMVAALVMAATPRTVVRAANGDAACLQAVEAGVQARWGGHRQRIPMQWLISSAAGLYTHGGVSRMHVVEIDALPKRIEPGELESLASREMSNGWSRIVREQDVGGEDQSLIYVKPEGNRLAMTVVSFDHGEMDMVQMSIEPEELSRQMRHWEQQDRHDQPEHPQKHEDSEDSGA